MRILYLFRAIAVYGGIERILVSKMNFLSSFYGYDVWMITTDQGHHPIPYQINANVHIEDLGICFYRQYNYNLCSRFWKAFKMKRHYLRMLQQRISEIQPDVIVCTTADDIGVIANVKGNVPLIVESHSIFSRTIEHGRFWFVRKYRKYRYLRNFSRVDCLVSLTKDDAKEWQKVHSKVVVIPNFVSEIVTEQSALNNKKAIFVGRLDYQKNAKMLIVIWAKVRQLYPDWVLDIYGEGDQEDELKKLAKKIGGVVVHKPTKNISMCYKESSLLLSTSLFEPFGLVLIEAMSFGIPIVAFDCPYGPSSIIEDGVTGYLISQNDIDSFVDKVCLLLSSKQKRETMGMAGRSKVSNYSPDIIMEEWKRLFESVKCEK